MNGFTVYWKNTKEIYMMYIRNIHVKYIYVVNFLEKKGGPPNLWRFPMQNSHFKMIGRSLRCQRFLPRIIFLLTYVKQSKGQCRWTGYGPDRHGRKEHLAKWWQWWWWWRWRYSRGSRCEETSIQHNLQTASTTSPTWIAQTKATCW